LALSRRRLFVFVFVVGFTAGGGSVCFCFSIVGFCSMIGFISTTGFGFDSTGAGGAADWVPAER
jgi:hypothetical protein